MTHVSILAAGLLLACASTSAFAADGSGGFIRGEVGESRAEFSFAGLTGEEKDTAYSLRGGYWFNGNIAVEGAYTGHGRGDLDFGYDYEVFSFSAGVALKKNFGAGAHQGFYVGGRLGAAYTDIAVVDDDGDVDFVDGDRKIAPYFGVGVGYDFTERFGLGLNYDIQNTEIDGVDVDLRTLAVSGEFRF